MIVTPILAIDVEASMAMPVYLLNYGLCWSSVSTCWLGEDMVYDCKWSLRGAYA